MKKNPEDIAYQVLHEVMFAGTDKKSSDAISKLLKQGKIRRIAPKIYTTNFEANGEDIVRRNIFFYTWQIVSRGNFKSPHGI